MQATVFFQSIGAIPIDVRYGGMPVAIAADLMGGKTKAKRSAKHSQEDCKALTKVLNEDCEPNLKITLGHNAILFADGSSFEHGKRYGYRNASQCYEALLLLHRDRLSRMSDEELQAASAIAAGDLL